MNRKFLILFCLVLFFVSIAGVSAAEDLNQTVDDNLVVSEDTLSVSLSDDEIGAKDDGTFTALQEKINNAPEGSTITLENDYKYDEGFSVDGIGIDKKLTINGNGYTIDALNKARIFEITGSNVILKNVQFYNGLSGNDGGAIYKYQCNLEVINCNFMDCSGYEGGAIGSYYGGLSVSGCSFVNCSALGGGAINTYYTNFYNVSDSSFVNCSARVGGAISSSDDLNFDNCAFINCTSSNDLNDCKGGAIYSRAKLYLNNCYFEYCVAKYGSNIQQVKGGAIYSSNFLSVIGCSFVNCLSTTYGGAIFCDEGSNLNVVDSNFIYCRAGTRGGAIFIDDLDNFQILNSNFTTNSADYGGAIYLSTLNDLYIIDKCNFNNNWVYYDGAVFYFGKYLSHSGSSQKTMKFTNLKFKDNVPNVYGGGISFLDNMLCIEGYHFNYISRDYDNITGDVSINIAGKTFKNTFDGEGKTNFDLSNIPSGTWDMKISYGGDYNFAPFEVNIPITIGSSTVLEVPDVTKDYGGSEKLEITLTESDVPIANADININLNGVDYPKTTDSNGKAALAINLNAGNYLATVTYQDVSTTATVTVNQLNTKTTLSSSKNSHNSVTLTATVSPSTATGDVVFTVNGNEYPASKISDSKATYTLNNLAVGSYDAKATYTGDVNHKSSPSGSVKFTVEDVKVDVSAPDLTKYYKGSEKFVVTVKEDNKPVVGKNVTIDLNGKPYTRTTDDNGQASMAINLNSGVYKVISEFEGIKVDSTITVKSTVSGNNVTKIFKNATQYYATFVDTKGNLMKNTEVKFNINGVFYTRTTDENGVAKMNINLPPKDEGYIITAENPDSTEKYTNVIKVLPSIVENHDLTKYYRNESKYTLRIIGDDGKPAGENVTVKLNINGVFYERKTNASGYMAMNINLPPGIYTVTAEYNSLRASNTITVLSVLETKDLKMSYKDGSKFEAKLLDGKGKPYVGQSVTFNINGVFYQKVTGDDGVARLAINLMAGEYIITSMFNGLNAANRVTILG